MESFKTIHITQSISQSGLCSRRRAKQFVFDGLVKVNGTVVTNPAIRIDYKDIVEVDGKPISVAPELRLWIYHKPTGLITTHKDPQGRPTVFENLPKEMHRVISVGRLDLNSEGLLLITNIGKFARFLELPSTRIKRIYEVQTYGVLDMKKLKNVSHGCTIEGIQYDQMDIEILNNTDERAKYNWVRIGLSEGKNREIRRVLKFCGLHVARLIRTSYGPYSLGLLAVGDTQEVKVTKELYLRYLTAS